jgi:hypothetical protein
MFLSLDSIKKVVSLDVLLGKIFKTLILTFSNTLSTSQLYLDFSLPQYFSKFEYFEKFSKSSVVEKPDFNVSVQLSIKIGS